MLRHRSGAVVEGSFALSKGVLCILLVALAAVLVVLAAVDDAGAAQTTVQAEATSLSGSQVYVRANTAASGGKEVAFFSNGSVLSSFDGAATEITLRGRGEACQGDPRLEVYVDGDLEGTVDLTSSTFANYTLALSGLSEGTHTLRVSFQNDFYVASTCDRNAYLDSYTLALPSTTPTTCDRGYFLAKYRNELRSFDTQPVLSRCEPAINYDWGSASPASGVNPDSFTARWVGSFDFEASDYEFTATADDGVRLFVDGELLIDQWKDQGATTYKATKAISAGTHQVKVKYYEYGGLAVAKASWAKLTSSPPPPPPPPPSGSDPVMVGAGDIARCPSAGAEATAKLLDGIEGTVYTTGDNAYESGTPTEFANCYDPTWGRNKGRTMPSPGNHEYNTSGASGYFGYFGASAGEPSRGYYSYDLGEWHIISLNSMCENVGGCGASSPMLSWLEQDLAANQKACTLAYFHHPLFSSGEHGDQSKMRATWDALYGAGADVVLNGHDHDYERFAPQSPTGGLDTARGIREFVVGTGGGSHYGIASAGPNSQVRNTDTYGVLKLTLHATSYDWQFVPEAGKTFTDSGTDACH
ncbi:MAG: metallophosphoesterase [Rubrobacteraceae bacterium]|nr:metallophosphoesterase [Rubrobacteraceae bacterium]